MTANRPSGRVSKTRSRRPSANTPRSPGQRSGHGPIPRRHPIRPIPVPRESLQCLRRVGRPRKPSGRDRCYLCNFSAGACPNICSCSRMAARFRWALAFSASAQPCARTIPLNLPRRCRSGARSSKDCGHFSPNPTASGSKKGLDLQREGGNCPLQRLRPSIGRSKRASLTIDCPGWAWFKRRSQLRGGSGPALTKSLLR